MGSEEEDNDSVNESSNPEQGDTVDHSVMIHWAPNGDESLLHHNIALPT